MAEDKECGNDDSLLPIAYVHSACAHVVFESHFILDVLLELLEISWLSIWNNTMVKQYLYHSFPLSNHRKLGESGPYPRRWPL